MISDSFDKHYNDATLRLQRVKALVEQIEAFCDEGDDKLHSQSSIFAGIALDEIKATYEELQKLWNSQVKSKQ